MALHEAGKVFLSAPHNRVSIIVKEPASKVEPATDFSHQIGLKPIKQILSDDALLKTIA